MESKNRSMQEIQQDYANLCVKAGQLQYQIYTFEKDLADVNKELRDLNIEAATTKAKEDAVNAELKVVESVKWNWYSH